MSAIFNIADDTLKVLASASLAATLAIGAELFFHFRSSSLIFCFRVCHGMTAYLPMHNAHLPMRDYRLAVILPEKQNAIHKTSRTEVTHANFYDS